MRRLAFVFRSAPDQAERLRDGLDAALAALAMDCSVTALFVDDGVFLLQSGQEAAGTLQKARSAGLGALLAHGAEAFRVEQEALAERGLAADRLLHSPRTVDRAGLLAALRTADAVISV